MTASRPSGVREPHLALVAGHPGRVGGMERFARFLAEQVLSAGWRITVALSGEDIYTGLVPAARDRLVVDHVDWIDETCTGDRAYGWKTVWSRHRWFRQVRPDAALFVQSSNTPFRAAVAGAWLAGVPIVTTHRTMAWPVEPAMSRKHFFGLIRGIALYRRLRIRKTWLTAAMASHIVYNSHVVRQGYENLYHYPHDKGRVIVNAMDEKLATMSRDVPADTDLRGVVRDVVIGFVGRLGIEKRLDVLLRAVAGLQTARKVRVIVYGEGPEEPSLRALAEELGICDRVEWAGLTDDTPSAYGRCDIVVLCSPRESSSNMVLEAMSAGKAVVVTTAGGLPELVRHGQCGVCVPPCHVEALRTSLDRLIDDDTERTRLGARARETARMEHDAHVIGGEWLQLLAGAAGYGRPRSWSLRMPTATMMELPI